MTEAEQQGKIVLMTILAILVLFDLLGGIELVGRTLEIMDSGFSLLARAVRLALTLLICSELYKGSIAARRVVVGLSIIVGLLLLPAIRAERDPDSFVIGSASLVLLFAFNLILVHSRSINAFMAYQRQTEFESQRQFELPGATDSSSALCPICAMPNDKHAVGCPKRNAEAK